jgi:hypothetical protein
LKLGVETIFPFGVMHYLAAIFELVNAHDYGSIRQLWDLKARHCPEGRHPLCCHLQEYLASSLP